MNAINTRYQASINLAPMSIDQDKIYQCKVSVDLKDGLAVDCRDSFTPAPVSPPAKDCVGPNCSRTPEQQVADFLTFVKSVELNTEGNLAGDQVAAIIMALKKLPVDCRQRAAQDVISSIGTSLHNSHQREIMAAAQ